MASFEPAFDDLPYRLMSGLFPSKRGWELWKSSPDDARLEAIGEIHAKDLFAFLPYLAPLLIHKNAEVRDATAGAVARLFKTDFSARLASLSVGLGKLVQYEPAAAEAMRGITKDQVRSLNVFQDHAWAAFGLLSFHGNGWTREAALDRLAPIANGREIPFLLYRSNDWVDLVAIKASALVSERVQHAPIRNLSRHLLPLFDLRSRRRGYLNEFQGAVLQRIAREEDIAFLTRAALEAATTDVRRWILSIATAAASSRPEAAKLSRGLRRDGDPIVRAHAWESVWNDPSAAVDLREGLSDSWPVIRRRSLEALCISNPALYQSALVTALFDSSSMVRATARYFLEKIPGSDVPEAYRDRLRSGRMPLASAILGLSECGRKEDVELLRPFLGASRVAIRRAAVFAVGNLDALAFPAEIKAALHDASRSVSKAARLVLAKHPDLVSRDCVAGALAEEQPLHVRRAAIHLISALTKWDRIVMLLEALTTAPEFNDLIRGQITRWLQSYNRSFTQPSPNQLAALKMSIVAQAAILSPEVVSELSQIASTFRR